MKRVSLLILTFIYLLSCSGIVFKRFYCCGKLYSVSVVYGAADDVNKPSTQKNQRCCQHEQQNFKLKDAHFAAAAIFVNTPLPALLPRFNNWAIAKLPKLTGAVVQHQMKAKEKPDVPIYTLYCDYRI